MADQRSAPSAGEQVVNALKLIADVVVLPGSGQLAEGKVREGLLYGIVGVTAKIVSPVLGPLAWVPWVGVGLDSFSKSAAGKHLWELGTPRATVPAATKEPTNVAP
jgi:hypothetical protein